MRYIIRRIIIGVGIAIAMMMITKTFSLKAYASTTFNVNPTELRLTYTNTNNNTNTATYTPQELTDVYFPYNTFYGKSSSNSGYDFRQLLFRLELPSSAKNGYYDVNYLFYNENMTSPVFNAYSFSLRNNSRIFTCYSFDPSNNVPYVFNNSVNPSTYKYILAVKCENVYLTPETNNVVYSMVQPSQVKNYGGAYGISTTTFQVNSSSSIQSSIEENTQAQNETNDILNDDDTTDAQNSGSSFFNNFSNTDHGGLSGVITAPLRFINNLLGTGTMSGQCTRISIPLPFVNRSVLLPCASTILFDMGSSGENLYSIITTITTGIIAYWVIVKIFAHVRSFKKPDEDKVEVLDL